MKQNSLLGFNKLGFHHMFYTEWGRENDLTLLCVHGLTRNGRDFDALAKTVSATRHRRVVCPDIVGRGRSDWLSDYNFYEISQYIPDIMALIARLNIETLEWLGTSMGGLMGIILASQPNSPIKKLILNDIGPFVSKKALMTIKDYAGKDYSFHSLEEVMLYFQNIYGKCDNLTHEEWKNFASKNIRKKIDGTLGLVYDPKIIKKLAENGNDINLFETWDKIKCPVVLLHATDSDILLAKTVQEMKQRGPKVEVIELKGLKHAPLLISEYQREIVKNLLD